MNPHLILGIDPGLSGGLAFLASNGRLITTHNMPNVAGKIDAQNLAEAIRANRPDMAFVEAVSSRPRQAGQFQFGINTGVIHGVLGALNVPMQLVAPASWKASFGIKRRETETYADKKNEARALAAKLFPAHAKAFSRVKDDGVAEAALIALHGLNLLINR